MYKYFLELKTRFILLFVTWLSTICVGYYYKEILLFLFLEPDLLDNLKISFPNYFIFTDVFEIFSVYLQLILFVNLQILLLYFFYHFFIFLSTSLFTSEYFYLLNAFRLVILTWFLSIFLTKYFVIPLTWYFFLSFKNLSSITLHFEAKLNEYLFFYMSSYYWFTFYSQTFVFLFFFMNFVNKNLIKIKKFKKIYYYFFIIFSTLISPPDVISQIFISLAFIILYELFMFILLWQYNVYFLIRQPVKAYKNSDSK